MTNLYTKLGLFLIGFSDSISLKWITGILFYADPKTKKILKQSYKLQKTLGRSLLQAGVITTLLPIVVRLLGFEVLFWMLTVFSLLFTYSYLTFWNMQVTKQAMNIIVWKHQQQQLQLKNKTLPSKQVIAQLDVKQNINGITQISNQIKSFLFEMAYYTPMNLIVIVITLFDQTYFPIILVIMDSFFNTCFYFFRKWPYDQYNVAFLEKNMPYTLGYGFFVSLVVNIVLPSSMSIGGYLLMSQWMIINALSHSPPDVQFHSFSQIWNVLRNREERKKLKNAYNLHRRQLNNAQYRKKLLKDCYFMKSYFAFINKLCRFIDPYLKKINKSQLTNFKQELQQKQSTQSKSQQLQATVASKLQMINQNQPDMFSTTVNLNDLDLEQKKDQ